MIICDPALTASGLIVSVYLAVGMVSWGFVGFVDHHTLHLGCRAGVPRQVIHHHLRCQKENPLRSPQLLSLVCRCATWKRSTSDIKGENISRSAILIYFYSWAHLSVLPCVPEGCPWPCSRLQFAEPQGVWWEPWKLFFHMGTSGRNCTSPPRL